MKPITFQELSLSKEILSAIQDMGFEEASPIQAQAIPILLKGEDVVGQAMTGTGKTAAFGIPAIEKIDSRSRHAQVLILCPTRELAIQVGGELNKLLKYKKGITELPIYGGQPIERQMHGLRRGAQIIIGTPGRVMDHMRRGTLKLNSITTVILDEADEMLNMGFREDIEIILKSTPKERQTVLFSATMPPEIMRLAQKYQKNPQIIKVVHEKLTVPSVEQMYYEVSGRQMRMDLLCRLIDLHNPALSIVFCNTKRMVDEVASDLAARGYFVEGIHGDISQSKRNRIMTKFRKGETEILVATDVAARGIDVGQVEAVFNYDMPHDEEYYVHRIGRTARAGRTGKAFSFVFGRELYKIKAIQRYTKATIRHEAAPSLGQVEETKSEKIMQTIKTVIKEGALTQQVQVVEKLLAEGYTSLDIAASLLKIATGYPQKAAKEPREHREHREPREPREHREPRHRMQRRHRR